MSPHIPPSLPAHLDIFSGEVASIDPR